MLETRSRRERKFGVAIDEQEFAAAGTRAEPTTLVNRVLAEAA
ncbi:hypothetical protein [Streptomyces sp. NPDC085529]